MKIAIYIPNLTRNSGGAEVYAARMACVLSKKHSVALICLKALDGTNAKEIMKKLCGVDDIEILEIDFWQHGRKFFKEISYSQVNNQLYPLVQGRYDLFINCTFGSLPAVPGVKSIHVIHFPCKPYKSFFMKSVNQKYINSYDGFWCNSEFTSEFFRRYWMRECDVLYPPIDMRPIDEMELQKKENIILAVDRIVKEKKIVEMVTAFSELQKKMNSSYRMVIIGKSDSNEKNYYKEVLEISRHLNVTILVDASYGELCSMYKRAKIFWHAKGYGENDNNPYRMEHFGMTTVEAMVNGCVPVVIDKAGQKEIVSDENGYKWIEIQQLIEYTKILCEDEKKLISKSKKAIEDSKRFLLSEFDNHINCLIDKIEEEGRW